MSALTRPRGPLPARTYWTRRILVLGSALTLVVGLGMMLTRSSDGSGGGGAVTPVSADESSSGTAPASDTGTNDSTKVAQDKKKKKKKKKKPALPQPSGPCLDADVDVTPVVKDAVAGDDVSLRFRIETKLSPACTWQSSPQTLTLKITSGKDLIWTSQQCPKAVPTEDFVLRREKASWLKVTWSAKRSDEECSRLTDWALPGWYHIAVAPLGGEPEDLQFKLSRPERPVVTAAPEPEPTKPKKKDKKKSAGATASASPSGAVEPNG